jgi:flagellar basal body-associated protein FliL
MAVAQEEKEGKESKETPTTTGTKKPWLLLGILTFQGVVIIALIVFLVLSRAPDGGAKEVASHDVTAHSKEEDIDTSGFAEGEPIEGEKPLGAIVPLETLLVNLVDSGYIRVNLAVEFIDRDVPLRFYARQVLIRDALLALISAKKRDVVLSSDGKERLRTEIKELINAAIKEEKVERVLYTEYLVR